MEKKYESNNTKLNEYYLTFPCGWCFGAKSIQESHNVRVLDLGWWKRSFKA